MAEGGLRVLTGGGEGAGGKGLPTSPASRPEESWASGGGAWSGRGAAADVKSLEGPGGQNQAACPQPGSGVVWREFGGRMQCEAGRRAGRGPALEAEARGSSERAR